MKKSILVCTLICAILFSGCQLAKEDCGEQGSHDRLIGVFVTKEHLDLFDIEAYLQDHPSALLSGGENGIENEDGYSQRVYANMDGGNCEFEDLDGILFASYAFDDGITKGYRNAPQDKISDGNIFWDETESGVTLTMEGTILVSDQIGYLQYFYNPVRQDSEGRVYLTEGTGLSANVTEGDGTKTSHNLNDEYTVTVNGKTQSYRADIRIAVETIALPEKYVVSYMDENHQELGKAVFQPEEVPQEIHPPEETEYILVEAHGKIGRASCRERV